MKSFYPHSGGPEGQGCMVFKKLWQKLMWRLQPKAAKTELWNHPWAVSLDFPVTVQSDFSSRVFREERSLAEAEMDWMKVIERVNWSSAGRWFSSRRFLQRSLGSLPPLQCEGMARCPVSSHRDTTGDCQQVTFLWAVHMFCFSSFFWLAAYKQQMLMFTLVLWASYFQSIKHCPWPCAHHIL